MDEVKHVHWHLVPRYNLMGFNLLRHKPGKLASSDIAEKLRKVL